MSRRTGGHSNGITSQAVRLAVRDLLIEKEITTRLGNPDWAGFAQLLEGVSYETLRKAVVGERSPAPKLMEAVSDALDVHPKVFAEYRIIAAQRDFDPREVGLDAALANAEKWLSLTSAPPRGRVCGNVA
jgi:hypothetical protein